MPAQIAVCYAPNATGTPANSAKTGSFYIGNMNTRAWGVTVAQTVGGNTQFFASPITSSGYIAAIPKSGPVDFGGVTQPQFFQSTSIADGPFIAMCSYILKNYTTAGAVNPGSPADPTGCTATAADCITKFNTAGWFTNYGLIVPA